MVFSISLFQFTPKKNAITFCYVVLFHLLIASQTWICSYCMFSTGGVECHAQLGFPSVCCGTV